MKNKIELRSKALGSTIWNAVIISPKKSENVKLKIAHSGNIVSAQIQNAEVLRRDLEY